VSDLDRTLGVQLNNEVWDTLDAGVITPDSPVEDRERLLYAAYASTHHWLRSGTVANHARGEHLIARAALQTGFLEAGLRHAIRCRELVEANPEAMKDWDRGFALEVHARALAAAGDLEVARSVLDEARTAMAAVADPDDRNVLEAQLGIGPWFGLGEPAG
jgi:hypothetical protein